MFKETDLLWHTKLYGDFENPKGPYMTEKLYGYMQLTREMAEDYPRSIEMMRRDHRHSVSDRVVEALYKGWLPYEMEWWEGYVDDPWTMRDYLGFAEAIKEGDDIYHFWTRIKFAALKSQPMLNRGANLDSLVSISTVSPQSLI